MITFNTTEKTITFQKLSDAVEFMRQWTGQKTPDEQGSILAIPPVKGRRKKATANTQWESRRFTGLVPKTGIMRIVYDTLANSDKPLTAEEVAKKTRISKERSTRAASRMFVDGIIKRTKTARSWKNQYTIADATVQYEKRGASK